MKIAVLMCLTAGILCGCRTNAKAKPTTSEQVPYPSYRIFSRTLKPELARQENELFRNAIKEVEDKNLSQIDKREKLWEIFDKYFSSDMSLREVAEVFAQANWFNHDDVTQIDLVGGWHPIQLESDATLFVIPCFRFSGMKVSALYFQFSGHLSREKLISALRGNLPPAEGETSGLKKVAFVIVE